MRRKNQYSHISMLLKLINDGPILNKQSLMRDIIPILRLDIKYPYLHGIILGWLHMQRFNIECREESQRYITIRLMVA